MPIHNPSDLYTFGDVKINTQPSVKMYAQLMARKQAKEDALSQYYSKAISDVTDAGMRNKDVKEGWAKKVNDWQTKYMNPEKRRFLANPRLDNYKTVTEFNQEHQDIIQDANWSKAEAKDTALINQQRFSGKWNPTGHLDPNTGRPEKGSDLDISYRQGLSIYDPKRKDEFGKDPDISDLSFNVPEFTPLQEQQAYKAATGSVPKDEHYDEKRLRKDNSGMQYVPKLTGYTDPKKVETIMDNYSNNMTKAQSVKYENLMHNQEAYSAATKAYQQFKGADAVIDTSQKMAAGMAAINAMKDVSEKEVQAPDFMLRAKTQDAFARSRMAVQDFYTTKHIAYKAALDLGNILASDANVDEVFNTMGNDLPADLVKKVFETPKDDQGHQFPPPSIKKSEDGKNYVFYYGDEKDKNYYHKEVPVAIVKTQWKHDAGTALKTKTDIPAPKTTSGYTQITETDKGQLGVKNGKWYYTKTGKPYEE